jgi:acylphosphatase
MIKRAHIFISGRVQGVFFRAHAQREARSLGLAGWVRNLPDGRVEITAEGEETALASLIDWARVGPSGARVDDLTVKWETPRGEERGFMVLPR